MWHGHSQNPRDAAGHSFLPAMPEAIAALFKSLLVVEIQAEQAILLAQRYRRPPFIERPLDANYLRVTASYISYISKRQVRSNLLFDGKPSLRTGIYAGQLRVDLDLADSKEPLKPPRHWTCQGLADKGRRTHLIPTLRRSRRACGKRGVGRRRPPRGQQCHDIGKLQRRVGAVTHVQLTHRS